MNSRCDEKFGGCLFVYMFVSVCLSPVCLFVCRCVFPAVGSTQNQCPCSQFNLYFSLPRFYFFFPLISLFSFIITTSGSVFPFPLSFLSHMHINLSIFIVSLIRFYILFPHLHTAAKNLIVTFYLISTLLHLCLISCISTLRFLLFPFDDSRFYFHIHIQHQNLEIITLYKISIHLFSFIILLYFIITTFPFPIRFFLTPFPFFL